MATFFQRTSKFTRGIRFRLSMVYSALFGVCLVVISLFVTGEYLEFARDEHDQFLRNFAIDLSQFVRPGRDANNVSLDVPLSEKIKYFPFVIQNTAVTVRHIDGTILYNNRPDIRIPFELSLAVKSGYSHRHMDFLLPTGVKMRGVNVRVPHEPEDFIIQVASTVENLTTQQDRHLFFLLLIIPLSILVTAFTSTIVAGKALDPIRATIQRMEELLRTESYRSLPVPDTHDEIADLTRTYNNMLARVKKTLEAQDQFVAHASHQLNTPLAIMRGELEVLLSKNRSAEETQRFHESLAQELERMGQLVRDMLLVSRVEAGKAHFRFAPVRLDEVVTETVARLAPRAKDKSIALKLDLDPALMDNDVALNVTGERQLLTCLCENLVENAIKYSPPNSSVQVSLRLNNGGVCLEVCDHGPGVPLEVRQRLQRSERFFRGEHTANISGSGLGLYLVGRIAEYHSSPLEILDRAPQAGAHFRISFPQNPSA